MADLNIAPKYAKFFLKNLNTRHVLLCGSRRSAKSYNVFKWNTLRALGKDPLHIIVCTASFPATKLAISDFQDSTGIQVNGSVLTGYTARLPNGSIIQFMSFDRPTKAQGSHCDIAIIEEALNIDPEILSVFLLGVRKQAYFVFNPTRGGIIDEYIREDKSNLLVTTYKDNPYLLPEQIEEFTKMEKKAMSPTASPLDIYHYKVYCKGEFSEMGGKVFPVLYKCTDEFYDNLMVQEALGMDFGWTDSGDSTVLMGIKIFQNCLYVKQYINEKNLANNETLAHRIADCGFTCYNPIFADYGGCGGERIKKLCSAGDYTWTDPDICRGFDVRNAKKGKVVDGLNRMLQYDKIIITESSEDARTEFGNYELGPEGEEVSKHQNCVDATRYAVNSYGLL